MQIITVRVLQFIKVYIFLVHLKLKQLLGYGLQCEHIFGKYNNMYLGLQYIGIFNSL